MSRRTALIGAAFIILILIGAVAASRPARTSTQYVTTTLQVTNTSYVTSVQNQFVTTTRLEQTTVTQVTGTGAQLVEYCFSPRGNCAAVLIKWIDQASKSVHVLVYVFTLDNVRDALIRAKNRGVDVKVVIDSQQSGLQGGEYTNLKNAGVDVRLHQSGGTMYDRVVIIDGLIVITGSFDWTAEADEENDSNLAVIRNPAFAQAFEQQFAVIWNQATQ